MSVRGRPLHFWLCDWCDCKDDFTPIFDIFTCGRRDDVYPWGDFICCENDCALFGVFEVPLLAPPPLKVGPLTRQIAILCMALRNLSPICSHKENEWETGYCSFCNADFCPVFCPRYVCPRPWFPLLAILGEVCCASCSPCVPYPIAPPTLINDTARCSARAASPPRTTLSCLGGARTGSAGRRARVSAAACSSVTRSAPPPARRSAP